MPSIGFTGIKFCHIGDKEAKMRACRREDMKNREQTYRKRLSSSNIFQTPSYRDLYETFYFYFIFIFPYQAHTLTLIQTYGHSYIHRYIIIYIIYFSNVVLLLIFVDVPDCTTVCMF